MNEMWKKLERRIGYQRIRTLLFLFVVGCLGVIIQFLIVQRLYSSALLYVLVPYLVAVFIACFRPYTAGHGYLSHIVYALIIFLSTSIVLGEGFVCVAFFFPIYLLIISFLFFIDWLIARSNEKKNKLMSIATPLLFLLMSLEGTTDSLSLSRKSFVEVSKIVPLSVNEVKQNLAEPFSLEKDRNWMLSIFPMPYRIEAGSLVEGDVHRVYTRYHRWFVTNTHEGVAELLIEDVSDNQIKTKLISDTTYFSSYLTMTGTTINLIEVSPEQTEIKLRINYQRKLDPAWYFHPLTKFGVSKMADLLLEEVMVRA